LRIDGLTDNVSSVLVVQEVKMPQAESVWHIDTEDVRVTEWRMEPGASTGLHRHDCDFVIVPLTDGTLRNIVAGGVKMVTITPGKAFLRKAPLEHDAFNAGDAPLAFVEVELLKSTPR